MATTTFHGPDAKLTHPLAKLRGYIRVFVLVDVALFVALFLLLWFWLGVAFDFGLFKLTGFDLAQSEPDGYLRGFFLVAFTALLVGLVVWRVWALFTKEFSYPALALVLEKRYPKLLGDRLITAVELADIKASAKYGYSADLIEHTIREAREAVDYVSVGSVFNWKRLRNKIIALAVIGLIGITSGLVAHSIAVKGFQPTQYGWKLLDVSSIWAERNLFLMKTPWPRRAYVEIVGFPPRQAGQAFAEIRVPKGDMPTVRARVYKWVHVDRKSYHGWQPLRWKHLDEKKLGFARPDLLGVSAGNSITIDGVPPDEITIDKLELLYAAGMFQASSAGDELKRVMDRLEEIANDPWYTRIIRKLDTSGLQPQEVTDENGKTVIKQPSVRAITSGIESGNPGEFNLTRDPSGEFIGTAREPAGAYKESVLLAVEFEDFRTAQNQITLIPPPTLRELKRIEYQPAYLHHPAPIDGDQASLTNKKQMLPANKLSLNGDRTLFSVPIGTELTFECTADKPLSTASLVLKGRPEPFPLTKPSETGFDTFSFDLKGLYTVRGKSEFLLTLVDMDNVSNSRIIEVSVIEDTEPVVELGVDALRKIGGEFWITARARIPFDPQTTTIKDDLGLRDLKYVFSWTPKQSEIAGLSNMQLATCLMMGHATHLPTLGTPALLGANTKLLETYQSLSGSNRNVGNLSVKGFQEQYAGLTRRKMAEIEPWLNRGIVGLPEASIRSYSFNPDLEAFDLEAPGTPKVAVESAADIQPRYELLLSVEATDTNSDYTPAAARDRLGAVAGGLSTTQLATNNVGRVTRSLTPIRFLIVSEEDLLSKISGDEEDLAKYAKDSVTYGREAKTKLTPELSQLLRLDLTAEQKKNSAIRMVSIIQDVGRIRDTYLTMQGNLSKVIRELRANRFNKAIIERWSLVYLSTVETTLKVHIKEADEALSAFQSVLMDPVKNPSQVDIDAVRAAIDRMNAQLELVSQLLGDPDSFERSTKRLADILQRQKIIQQELEMEKVRLVEILKQPRIAVAKQYSIKAGQTASLTVPIVWGFYIPPKNELGIRVELPDDSELKAPARIAAKDDRDDFKLDITAGQKTGIFTIKLTPDVGKQVELRIEVTK